MPPKRPAGAEACGFVETKVQYKDHETLVDFIVDHDALTRTVDQIKRALLQCDQLKDVISEQPEKLGLFLILQGDMVDNQERKVEMADDRLLMDFSTEVASATILKLLDKE